MKRKTVPTSPPSNGKARTGANPATPCFGLVCITHSAECRFRAITRTRYLAMEEPARRLALMQVYWENLSRLHWALSFCARRGIRLYRATSGLFPLSDEPLGVDVLRGMAANLSSVGRRAARLGVRVLLHPDQFVVLNSESPDVVQTSKQIMDKHALAFDLLGLPRSPWSAMILHGGKSGRGDALVDTVRNLADPVRSRLVLENDEYSFGAAEILDVCRRAGVPMVFDAHHHVVKEELDSYEHPSVAAMTRAARDTWPDPAWQVVHLSNGKSYFADRNHSDLIAAVPRAYADVPWIEVEAKGKESAIAKLQAEWPGMWGA